MKIRIIQIDEGFLLQKETTAFFSREKVYVPYFDYPYSYLSLFDIVGEASEFVRVITKDDIIQSIVTVDSPKTGEIYELESILPFFGVTKVIVENVKDLVVSYKVIEARADTDKMCCGIKEFLSMYKKHKG